MNACCKDAGNLTVIERAYDRETRECQVCHCKHRKLVAETGALGAMLRGLGK